MSKSLYPVEAVATWIKRVKTAHAGGLLSDKEKVVLLKREDGYTLTSIGADMGVSKQRVAQLFERGNKIVRTGHRPKRGRPAFMPEEYVVKLTQRQKDALRSKGIRRMILEAETKDHPYWTHCLVDLLDQVAEQNNTETNVKKEGELL
jgi:hypothetical protein